jgi:hypothetical protein
VFGRIITAAVTAAPAAAAAPGRAVRLISHASTQNAAQGTSLLTYRLWRTVTGLTLISTAPITPPHRADIAAPTP